MNCVMCKFRVIWRIMPRHHQDIIKHNYLPYGSPPCMRTECLPVRSLWSCLQSNGRLRIQCITKRSAFCGNRNGGRLTSGNESVGASGHFENWNARRGRVARLVTKHLVSQRSANFWRVLLWISCQKRNFSPTICSPTESWIVETDEEMSQMWTSRYRGDQTVETKNHQTLWKTIIEHAKMSLKVALLPLWFQDNL
jgi:hypothetical protein